MGTKHGNPMRGLDGPGSHGFSSCPDVGSDVVDGGPPDREHFRPGKADGAARCRKSVFRVSGNALLS